MINSMTGYANVSRDAVYGAFAVELRAVNHRYLELAIKVPEELRALEAPMREAIAARIGRGKVDCRLAFTPVKAAERLPNLNSALLKQLLAMEQQVQRDAPRAAPLSTADVLRWPGIFAEEPQPMEQMTQDALNLLGQALQEFSASRRREGDKLQAILLDRVEKMHELVRQVAPKIPAIVAGYQEKLAARLAESLTNADDDRMRQEVVLFASKIDVDEELSRLTAHLTEVKRVLEQGGVVGKRLDFLMQELNRESNTLGAKSAAYDVSRTSVELKILIEQMREQVQNIE
jgi:uncharacterized protein (TIGR00255 family)